MVRKSLVYFLVLVTLFAWQPEVCFARGERYHFINLTERDGYKSTTIRDIFQDSRGYMWFCHDEGLTRFNGSKLQAFNHVYDDPHSISGNATNSITEDRWGKLWISTTHDGLNCYDPATNRFSTYKSGDTGRGPKLVSNSLRQVWADSRSRLWIGYDGYGWSTVDLNTWETQHYRAPKKLIDAYGRNAADIVLGFCEDASGGTWLISNYGLHFQSSDGVIQTFSDKSGVIDDFHDNLFTSCYRWNDSIIWLGTWGAGLKSFNTRTKKFETYLWDKVNPIAVIKNIVLDIKRKSSNELWIASADKGLGVFSITNRTFGFIPHDPANPNTPLANECYSIFIDRQRTLWAGFYTGISRLTALSEEISYTPIKHRKEEYLIHVFPICFWYDQQTRELFFGCNTGSGLYVVDSTGKEHVIPIPGSHPGKDAVSMINIFAIHPLDQQVLLLGTGAGLKTYHRKTGEVKPLIIKDQDGKAIWGEKFFPTPSGLWMNAGANGFNFVSKDLRTAVHHYNGATSPIFLPSTRQHIVYVDNDTAIWFCTLDAGLFILNPQRNTIRHIEGTNGRNFLGRGMVKDRKGHYWLASEEYGLYELALQPDGNYQITQWDEDDGLQTTKIGLIAIDPQGNITVGTQRGPAVLFAGEKRFASFSANNLISPIRPFSAMYADQEGNVRHTMRNGFLSWNNELLKKCRKQAELVFEQIKVQGKNLSDTADIRYVKEISLPYNQSNIEVSFTLLDYQAPQAVQYFHLLEGSSNNWEPCEQTISYQQLAAGNYKLRIKAINGMNLPASNELVLDITIHPPFWKTWWFFLLCIAFVCLAFFLYVKIRIAAVKKEEQTKAAFNKALAEVEMKALRAQMNPHFLFNCLNSINRYIVIKDTKNASNYLTKFSKLIRLILENSAKENVSLTNEKELLKLYIEMESMRFESKFTYDIETENLNNSDEIMIPAMIIQPYIENAIWHGLLNKDGDRHLQIRFRKQDELILEVRVEDNGIGRDHAKELRSKSALAHKSYGMSITSQRIQALNNLRESIARVHIEDLKDNNGQPAGTRVVITIPYEKQTQNR